MMRKNGSGILALSAGALCLMILIGLVGKTVFAEAKSPWGPVVSEEFLVDDPVAIPHTRHQFVDLVGFGGASYLFWYDTTESNLHGPLYLTRFSDEGTVLDPFGLNGYGESFGHVGASDNQALFLQSSYPGSGTAYIYARRFDADGNCLDPNSITIATVDTEYYLPDSIGVAFNGSNYLLAYFYQLGTMGSNDKLYVRSLNPNGSIGSAILLMDEDFLANRNNFRITSNGDEFLLLRTYYDLDSPRVICGMRLNANGTSVNGTWVNLVTDTINTAEFMDEFEIVWDGTYYWLVYKKENASGYLSLYTTRINTNLEVLDPDGILIWDSTLRENTASDFDVTTDGTQLLLTVISHYYESYVDYNKIQAVRIGLDGTVLDDPPILLDELNENNYYFRYMHSTYDGTNFVVGWMVNSADLKSFVSRISPDGTLLDLAGKTFAYSSANEQDLSAIGCNGADYLVAWRDKRESFYGQLFGVILSPEGNPKTASFPIDEEYNESCRVDDIHIASDGTDFYVSWMRGGAIRGTKVSAAGVVQNPDGQIIYDHGGGCDFREIQYDLTYNGQHYLLGYFRALQVGCGTYVYEIIYARIGVDGAIIDYTNWVPHPIYLVDSHPQVRIAYDGVNTIIAFPGKNDIMLPEYQLYVYRLDSDYNIPEPNGISLRQDNDITMVRIVGADDASMIVFSHGNDLYGYVLNQDGTAGDLITIATGLDPINDIVLSYDGALVHVNYTTTIVTKNNSMTYGFRLNPDGTLYDPAPYAIGDMMADPYYISSPSIASRNANETIFAYASFAEIGDVTVQRVVARSLGMLPLGLSCDDGSQCVSGYCIDGVCCENACGDGVTDDCQACSEAAGGTDDGYCTPANTGTVCRPAAGLCDEVETCDGSSTDCPADVFVAAGDVCRDAVDDCDIAEQCTGTNAACPTDEFLPNGTACDDELYCTVDDICTEGICDGDPRDCDDGQFCTGVETCDEANDECDSPGDPCATNQTCNEETDDCDPNVDDDDTTPDDDDSTPDDDDDDTTPDDDDIDDDDNDDNDDTCESFCNRVESCGLTDFFGVDSMSECLSMCAKLQSSYLNCAKEAATCKELAACFGVDGSDDDDDDDDSGSGGCF